MRTSESPKQKETIPDDAAGQTDDEENDNSGTEPEDTQVSGVEPEDTQESSTESGNTQVSSAEPEGMQESGMELADVQAEILENGRDAAADTLDVSGQEERGVFRKNAVYLWEPHSPDIRRENRIMRRI